MVVDSECTLPSEEAGATLGHHADSHSWTLTGQPPRSGFALARRGFGLGLGLALGQMRQTVKKSQTSDWQSRPGPSHAWRAKPCNTVIVNSELLELSRCDHAYESASYRCPSESGCVPSSTKSDICAAKCAAASSSPGDPCVGVTKLSRCEADERMRLGFASPSASREIRP